jgi:hypothetical protein
MTEYEFKVYGDAPDWTEKEKEICIKRHEQTEKNLRDGFSDVKWETIGKHLFIKTGEEDGHIK